MCKLRTHRGFAVAKPESIKEDDVKYVTVGGFDDLAVKLANSQRPVIPASEQLEVIKTAIEVIKMTCFSFKKQIDGDVHSTPEVVNFVESTCEFISTGFRRLPVYRWGDLLDHLPENYAEVPKSRSRELLGKYGDVLDLPLDLMMSRWLSHPGGFQDMVMTMHLVFSEKNNDQFQSVQTV